MYCEHTDIMYVFDEGYTGLGQADNCLNINECGSSTSPCPVDTACIDTDGSYECVCRPGFKLDNGACVNIDDCALGNDCTQVSKQEFSKISEPFINANITM